MFKKVKNKVIVGLPMVAGTSILATPVLAVGEADAAVVSTFTQISEDIVATMGAVAPFGIAILAIFLAFRYGKRIFSALARG